jgi:hypothetical protein
VPLSVLLFGPRCNGEPGSELQASFEPY